MHPTDHDTLRTVPAQDGRDGLHRAAGEAILLVNEQRGAERPAEAVIAIMRQAGRLVDEHALARMTPMQCRVAGYQLAALLRMTDDPDSQRLAADLLACLGVGEPA